MIKVEIQVWIVIDEYGNIQGVYASEEEAGKWTYFSSEISGPHYLELEL